MGMGRHESYNEFETKEGIQLEEIKMLKSLTPCSSHNMKMLAEPMRGRLNSNFIENDIKSLKPNTVNADKIYLTVDDMVDI